MSGRPERPKRERGRGKKRCFDCQRLLHETWVEVSGRCPACQQARDVSWRYGGLEQERLQRRRERERGER